MDPRIADFIAKNQGKYTREAIRQQLIEAGHEPAAIDATWAILDTPDPDEAGLAGEGFWPRFFIFLIGLNVAVFLIVALTTFMFEQPIGLAGILAVALAIGALIAWGIVAAVGPAKLGRTTALVVGGAIPIVFALLIGGSCFALVSAIGPPPPPPVSGQIELAITEPFTLEGSGSGTCQPTRNSIGFSVYGDNIGRIDDTPLYISVDAYEDQPGHLVTNVSISALAGGVPDPLDWFSTPESSVQAEVAADGLSGTVTFTDLQAGTVDAAPPSGAGADAISGTISWSCG